MKQPLRKGMLDLAIPATIENLLQTLVGFVDTLLISKMGLIAVTVVGVANTVLNVYLAIFIALGVLEAAIGTANPRLIGYIFLCEKIKKSSVCFNWKEVFLLRNYKLLIRLSIHAALERLVMHICQVVYFGLIVAIGVRTFVAYSIAENIESFVYMPAYGLTTAASILVGASTRAII